MRIVSLFVIAALCAVVCLGDADGTCGDGVSWLLTSATRKLRVYGNGKMKNYTQDEWASYSIPWFNLYDQFDTVIIEKGVTTIGDHAFVTSKVKTLIIEGDIDYIGIKAFRACSTLQTIDAKGSVGSTSEASFQLCSSLSKVDFPNFTGSVGRWSFAGVGATTVDIRGKGTKYIGSYAFAFCDNLKSFYISADDFSVSESIFYDNRQLTDVTFVGNVYYVGPSSFSACSGVLNITGYSRFYGYGFYQSNLTAIYVGGDVERLDDNAFIESNETTDLVVGGSFKFFSHNISLGLPKLARVSVGGGVEAIKENAFADSSITSIVIEGSVGSIGSSAFSGCSELTTVKIGTYNGAFSNSMLMGCSKLNSLSVGGKISSIGSSAFSGCSSLTDMHVPSSVKSINDDAFSQCSALTNLTIESGVKTFGKNAFSQCISLAEVVIPSSVNSIKDGAFSGCTKLSDVKYQGLSDPGAESVGVFEGCSKLGLVIVPEGYTVPYFCGKHVNGTWSYSSSVIPPTPTSSSATSKTVSGAAGMNDFVVRVLMSLAVLVSLLCAQW